MKVVAIAGIVAAGLSAVTSAQARRSFDRTWTAARDGHAFARVELRDTAGVIAGSIGVGDMELDAQGVVKTAGALPAVPTPIFDVAVKGATLSFARRDDRDVDRFELRMIDDRHAELRFVLSDKDRKELAAEGIPAPKPIALNRQQ